MCRQAVFFHRHLVPQIMQSVLQFYHDSAFTLIRKSQREVFDHVGIYLLKPVSAMATFMLHQQEEEIIKMLRCMLVIRSIKQQHLLYG